MALRRDLKNKRNVWTSEEVSFFISLIKEKNILGLMDGKRLRVSDIFKTLMKPMEEAGFPRDVSQLTVKWKNLKADYYKCKRHNGVSGNDPAEYKFYDALKDILGHRPVAHNEGFDTSQTLDVTVEELNAIRDDDPRIDLELYDDTPDVDGATPGSSRTPGILKLPETSGGNSPASSKSKTCSSTSKKSSSSKKALKPIEVLTRMHEDVMAFIKEGREEAAAADTALVETLLKQQAEMSRCTNMMVEVLREMFSNK